MAASTQRCACAYFALSALAGIFTLELVNTLRILATPTDERRFPQEYVSRGVWTAYAFVRPPDATSTDIADPLRAAQRVLQGDPSLYREFDGVGADYVYPPTAAIELLPFGLIADRGGQGLATQCVDVAGRLGALAILLVTFSVLRGIVATTRDRALVIVLIAAFFPIRWALFCVNAQALMNAFLVGAILAYARSRTTLCGVLLALASCLKPHVSVIFLFALMRREWRVAISGVVSGGGFICASVVLLGMEPWVTYVRDVLPAMSDGYAIWGNQSFLGATRRWVGDPYVFRLVPASGAVVLFGRCAAAILLVLAVFPRARQAGSLPQASSDTSDEDSATSSSLPRSLLRGGDISIALLAITMASPIAWDHHYGWTVITFGICLAASPLLRRPAAYAVLLAGSYVLLATDWIPVAADHAGPFSLLDSTKLFAAVLLVGLTWHVCRRLHGARFES